MALSAAQYGMGAVVTTLFHPIGYAKVLIQIGHEPVPPIPQKSIFRSVKLYYPNIFNYIKQIKNTDGFLGLYRGVMPRIVGGAVGNAVQSSVQEFFKRKNEKQQVGGGSKDNEEFVEWFKNFLVMTTQESAAKCLGIIVSQPFHVIMLRSMVQFVGGEDKYSGIISPFREIYQTDGIVGFFAGLVPRLIGEVIGLWITNLVAHLFNKYVTEDKVPFTYVIPRNPLLALLEMRNYTPIVIGLIVSEVTYPFSLVGNIMSVNNAGLVGTSLPDMPNYRSWTDCWSCLSVLGQLKRGSSIFWRQYGGPVLLRDGKPFAADFAFSQ